MDEERFWPFPLAKPDADWTRFDREYADFMRSAHADGYRPRARSSNFVAAESPSGRAIVMIFRGGRNDWEVCPSDGGSEIALGPTYALPVHACVCVRPPFSATGYFALEWLRGREYASLMSEFGFAGRSPPGIVLRSVASECPAGAGHPGVA